jgi:hypothetical protein
MTKPVLHRDALRIDEKLCLPNVLDTDLSYDRKLAEGFAIRITSDVSESFVPDMASAILPSQLRENGMHRRPSKFGVPEP